MRWIRELLSRDVTSLANLSAAGIRGAALGVLFLWIAARLPAEDFGQFAFLFAIARLVAPFASPGSAWSVQSQLAAGVAGSGAIYPSLRRSLVGTTAICGSLVAILAVVSAEISAVASASVIFGSLAGQVGRSTVLPLLLFTEAKRAVLTVEVSRPVLQCVAVGLVLVTEPSIELVGLAFALANSVWAASVVGAAGLLVNSGPAEPVPEKLVSVLQIAASQAVRSSSYSIDQVMMPAFISFAELGQYSLAAQFASLAVLAIGSVGEARQRFLYSSARRVLAVVAVNESRRLLLVALPVVCAISAAVIAASTLLRVVDSTVVFLTLVLLVAALALAAGYPLAHALTARADHDARFRIELLALGTNVILNLALLILIGPFGAAIATLLSEATLGFAARQSLLRNQHGVTRRCQ